MMVHRVKDKNPANEYGVTPLHIAAGKGHLRICKLIINNVENLNPYDDDGWTPLDAAICAGQEKAEELLCTSGGTQTQSF